MLAVSTAFAADLPRRPIPAAEVVVPPAFTWTGFYGGLNAGLGIGRSTAKTSAGDGSLLDQRSISYLQLDRTKYRRDGFVGGGQVGYNHQFKPGNGFVVGVEADIQYADLTRKRNWNQNPTFAAAGYTGSDQIGINTRSGVDFLGTVRGRLGYAADRVLIYGTGGLAYGGANYRQGINDNWVVTYPNGGGTSGNVRYLATATETQTGVAYGGGIEYALPTENILNLGHSAGVSLKAEYLHYDLGTFKARSYTAVPNAQGQPQLGSTTKIRNEGDLVRAGFNVKFGL